MSDLNWIKHDGGPMPVPGDTKVAVRVADGYRGFITEANASFYKNGSDWWDGTGIRQISEYAIMSDNVAPAIDAHYTKYAIQPMEFSLANGLDPAQHTVIKYVVRYRDKGGVRDLKAAIRVLELMIERAEKADG